MGHTVIDADIRSAWYDIKKPVLTNFSMHVEKGETVTVAGPSGAGKSTLLSIIAGLHKGMEGTVRTEGGIALMPQKDSLPPFYTVLENITLLAMAKGIKPDREKAHALLRDLGLEGFGDVYPNQLSGGQYKRAALGQALFAEPMIILMDEPFSGLDGDTKAGVIALFLRMKEKYGAAAVLVTHDMSEAKATRGRIVRLDMGRKNE